MKDYVVQFAGVAIAVFAILAGLWYFQGDTDRHLTDIDDRLERMEVRINKDLESIKINVREINGKVQDHEVRLAVQEATNSKEK